MGIVRLHKKLQNHKRGIFFTLLGLALIAVIFLVARSFQTSLVQTPPEELRIVQLNSFITELQNNYLRSALEISSYRAVKSLTLYVGKKKEFLSDFKKPFGEVVLYGTLDEQNIDTITGEPLMAQHTFLDLKQMIETKSSSAFQSTVKIDVLNVTVNQSGPWSINIQSFVNISISSDAASWNITEVAITTEIPIKHFSDPLFLFYFDGNYNRNFIAAPIENADLWSFKDPNTGIYTNVNQHLTQGTYTHWGLSGRGPSFLERFVSPEIDSPCCGIESLLDPRNANVKTFLGSNQESMVDYIAFQNNIIPCTDLYEIEDVIMPETFILDKSHAELYGIALSDMESLTCPE